MPLEQVNIVDPYVPWTGWGDYAFNDDVNAITTYIENQRPQIPNHPTLQAVIEDYEHWLTNLGWTEKYLTPDTAKGEAVYYRDKINTILGQIADPSIIPGDINKKIVPVDPNTAPSTLTNILNSIFGKSLTTTIKYVVVGGLIVASGGAILYLFGPAIRSKTTDLINRKKSPRLPTHTLDGTPIDYTIRNDIIKKEELP